MSDSQLILASTSPRRKFLLDGIGYHFTTANPGVDESFPADLAPQRVPSMLAERKAAAIQRDRGITVVAADTVVILDQEILNKPADRDEAIHMLNRLSNRTHEVVTGICVANDTTLVTDSCSTFVTFLKLSKEDITSYVDQYQPLDKAGSYGAQECLPEAFMPCSAEEVDFLESIGKSTLIHSSITRRAGQGGMTAIASIDGSYFNVMGFPVHRVYQVLRNQFGLLPASAK